MEDTVTKTELTDGGVVIDTSEMKSRELLTNDKDKKNEQVHDPSNNDDDDDSHVEESAGEPIHRKKGTLEDLSNVDLMKKLNNLLPGIDFKKSIKAQEIVISGKRIFGESKSVLLEVFRRFPFIKNVSLTSCFLTDELFMDLVKGLALLRHLQTLNLSLNVLTTNSLKLIIERFAKLPVENSIQILDLRDNAISDHDGKLLYKHFRHTIIELNGLRLQAIKSNIDDSVLNMSNRKIRSCEVTILCCLLRQSCPHIQVLNLSKNNIEAEGLFVIADSVRKNNALTEIHLSNNPLTESLDGYDLSGAIEFMSALKETTRIKHVTIADCGLPKTLEESILTAVAVNRSLVGVDNPTYFQDCVEAAAHKRAARYAKDTGKHIWGPSIRDVDYNFVDKTSLGDYGRVLVAGDNYSLPEFVPLREVHLRQQPK